MNSGERDGSSFGSCCSGGSEGFFSYHRWARFLQLLAPPDPQSQAPLSSRGRRRVVAGTAGPFTCGRARSISRKRLGGPVSYQRRDALEELEEASDPHKEELNEVDAPLQDQDEDVVIIEDEKLMEVTPAEEPSVTNQECTDKSEMQEHQVDDEEYHALLATPEESENDEIANFHDDRGSSSGLLDKGVCEETYDAGGDDEVCKEKEHTDIAELQADIVDEAAFLDCSGNIRQVAAERSSLFSCLLFDSKKQRTPRYIKIDLQQVISDN